jgi:large subunit ribosomal protein L21e|tara:strand:- start:171 stop:464 length:294 start_codon:yes stop_codon:yes gene_type:complete
MTKRSQGLRSGSRHKLSRPVRERGLSPITRSLQKFEEGDTVNVVIDPSYQRGQPHHRFHGLTGKVTGIQGKAYVIRTRVGKMDKELIVRPEHLRKAN